GIGEPELSMIRSLILHDWVVLSYSWLVRSRLLKLMPHLCKVTINRERTIAGADLDQRGVAGFLSFCNLEPLLQHVQNAANKGNQEAELVVDFSQYPTYIDAKSYVGYGGTQTLFRALLTIRQSLRINLVRETAEYLRFQTAGNNIGAILSSTVVPIP